MQNKMIALQKDAGKVGLEINHDKTKDMTMTIYEEESQWHFTLNGTPIKNVDCYIYLGSQITPNGGIREDVKHRIKKVKEAFAQLRSIWR